MCNHTRNKYFYDYWRLAGRRCVPIDDHFAYERALKLCERVSEWLPSRFCLRRRRRLAMCSYAAGAPFAARVSRTYRHKFSWPIEIGECYAQRPETFVECWTLININIGEQIQYKVTKYEILCISDLSAHSDSAICPCKLELTTDWFDSALCWAFCLPFALMILRVWWLWLGWLHMTIWLECGVCCQLYLDSVRLGVTVIGGHISW